MNYLDERDYEKKKEKWNLVDKVLLGFYICCILYWVIISYIPEIVEFFESSLT